MSKAQTVAEIAGPRLAKIRKFEQVSINTIHVYSSTVAEIAGPRLAEIRKFEQVSINTKHV